MEFSRQEYLSGLPFPSPEGLPEPGSPALLTDSLPMEPFGKPKSMIHQFQKRVGTEVMIGDGKLQEGR